MKGKQFQLPGKVKNIFLLLTLNMLTVWAFAQVDISGKVSGKTGNQANIYDVVVVQWQKSFPYFNRNSIQRK